MMENNNHKINRRKFLKVFGTGAVATTAALTGCESGKKTTPAEDAPVIEPPKDKLTYRENPNTGDKVSILGFGMMRLPTLDGTAARESNAPIDQETVNRLVDYALEHGVNYFDTSPAYCKGKSENSTGIALSRHPRNSYYIATKLSNFNPETWGRKESIEMFENSLKELQVDYVDYLLLHGIGMGEDGTEAFYGRYMDNGILDWLVEQKEKGRIRNLGFSYHGDIKVYDMLLKWHDEGKYHWDFVQIELNYLDWSHAQEINSRNTDASYLYEELEKRNIPTVIMEPLLGGRLSNVPHPIAVELKRRDPKHSVASWAFRYAGTPENVLTVLSGMTYMEHLKDNLVSYSPFEPLNEDEMQYLHGNIAQQIVGFETIPCNDCKYCMPCPYGVNIPAVFVHYNKCKNEGLIPMLSTDKNYKNYRRQFLVGYDRSVPRLRQASHCIGCGKCMSHCPQNIMIPMEMQKIDKFVEQLKQSE